MILLDAYNQAVDSILNDCFENVKESPDSKMKINHTVADFDGVTYNVKSGPEKKILVSISLMFFDELKKHGVMEFLRKEYGDLLCSQAESQQSISLEIDVTKLPEDHTKLARKCALLKRNCMAALFTKYFDIQPTLAPKSKGDRAVLRYRADETMYVHALPDRVTVIFSTVFKDADDMLIGKLFMQEFEESRRHLHRAPNVLYSHRNPPAELQDTNAVVSDTVAYLTFIFEPRHYAPGASRDRCIDLIHTLRNYLHYHIKCSKAYIQMRMRAKSAEFIKVINRALAMEATSFVVNVGASGDAGALYSGINRIESVASLSSSRNG